MTRLLSASVKDSRPVPQTKNYRPDIDGLRAIAVISVILYHFDIGLVPGGFVGVDIFFVISGYLITKGIFEKQQTGGFEFADFYFRRVRRLIPALLTTIAISYAVAFFIFSPVDFRQMSGSAVYALTGLSNVFFWLEAGYFDTASITKPLLHTWSLGVEIQFYIVWPAILYVILTHTRHHLIAIATLIAAGGAAAVFYLNIDSSGAFYLTPFRIHEFLFGAAVVVLEKKLTARRWHDAFYLIGLCLVAYSIFFYSAKTTMFPGYAAMVPSLGSALMIFSGATSRLSRPLSSVPAAKIGEFSYSLYLVHWPIFVFANYILIEKLSNVLTTALLVATAVSATALYFIVEKPFRSPRNSKLSGAEFSLATLGVSVAIILLSSNSWAENGWNWRMPKELLEITNVNTTELSKYTWNRSNELDKKEVFDPESNAEKILVIGDSQAADIINLLTESGAASRENIVSRVIYTNCNTPYVDAASADHYFTKVNSLTIQVPSLIEPCKSKITRALDPKLLAEADKIYIAFYWRSDAIDYAFRAVEQIALMTKAKVYVFGRKNLTKSSIDIVTNFGRLTAVEQYAAHFRDNETKQLNDRLSKAQNVTFVDMMSLTCPEPHSCLVLTPQLKPVFFDSMHLTKEGAQYLGGSFNTLVDSSVRLPARASRQ